MTSHGQQQWYDMEQFDLEEALRLFCETTTRSFLWGMWNEHQRSKILEQREQELEERIHQLETVYDEVDREYKATLTALNFEHGLACEQAETIADRNEDIRKLKMQIIELERRNKRLNTIVEAKRGVGQ